MSRPRGFTERACINIYLEKSQKDFLTKLAREQKISPSIDRVNNSKGYIKTNICVISFKVNTLKGHATSDELRKIADYMDSHKYFR